MDFYLDFDCVAIKAIPNNFWQKLREKGPLQAIIRHYVRKKAMWRGTVDVRKIPCASFVYINSKKVTEELIRIWEELEKPWSEEVVLAKYLDNLSEGWKGVDYYVEHYEPDFFSLPREQGWMSDKIKWKNIIFKHFNEREVDSFLKSNKEKK